ncbi:MAG TPA: glycosyltransferase family 39 protein [bacterium]|nr:glycosyltransferase family 39 protein [bacterium]
MKTTFPFSLKQSVAALLWLIPLLMLLALGLKFVTYGYPFSPLTQLPPQGWDDWSHLQKTFETYRQLQTDPGALPELARGGDYLKWPPLFYWLTAAALSIRYDVASLYAVLFLLAAGCLAAIYALARTILDDHVLALLAVALFTANPVWIETALSYNLETILLAATAAFFALLFAAPVRRGLPGAPLLGCVGALLLLSKTVILVPLLPAAIGFLLWNLRDAARAKRQWHGPLSFMMPGLLLIACWYLPQAGQWRNFLSSDLAASASVDNPPLFYVRTLFVDYLYAPLLVAALIAWRRRDESGQRMFADGRLFALVLGAVAGLVFFSLIGAKHEWYLLSPYLLLTLPTLAALKNAAPPWRRALIVALFLLYGGFTVYFAAWEMPRETPTRRLYPPGHSVLRGYANFKPPIAVVAHQLRAHFSPEDLRDLAILPPAVDDRFDWQAMQLVALHDARYVPFLFNITLNEQTPASWERLRTILVFLSPEAEEATCATINNQAAHDNDPQLCVQFVSFLRDHCREKRRIPLVDDYSMAVFRRVD